MVLRTKDFACKYFIVAFNITSEMNVPAPEDVDVSDKKGLQGLTEDYFQMFLLIMFEAAGHKCKRAVL